MQLLSYAVAIAQERAVFEEVETRFCECCAGEAFAAAPAPHACLPPLQLHFFLIVFGFDAQVGCGVVGFSSEVCASRASNDSIATHSSLARAAHVALQAHLLRPEQRVQATRARNALATLRSNGHDNVRMISEVMTLLLLTTMMMTTMTTITTISMMIMAILFAIP